MRLTDTLAGALTAAFGLAVIAYASTFPPMPGQPIGPGFFPIVVGVGLVMFGVGLAASGRRRGERFAVVLDDWTRKPRMVRSGLAVVAALVFYALAVDRLGFFVTSVTLLAALFAAFGVARRRILPIAVVVTFALHYAFYTLLRVPLPWGVLEGVAW